MNTQYQELFALFREIGAGLERLTGLATKKLEAVQRDDLETLNEMMNQEQAETLVFRGIERKRETLLSALGLSKVPLAALPAACPAEFREEAEQAVQALQDRYREYRSYADAARQALEHGLAEIEQVLNDLGGNQPGGPGYQVPETELPTQMRTDFRA